MQKKQLIGKAVGVLISKSRYFRKDSEFRETTESDIIYYIIKSDARPHL